MWKLEVAAIGTYTLVATLVAVILSEGFDFFDHYYHFAALGDHDNSLRDVSPDGYYRGADGTHRRQVDRIVLSDEVPTAVRRKANDVYRTESLRLRWACRMVGVSPISASMDVAPYAESCCT